MARESFSAVLKHVATLFQFGTAADLTDGSLLDRFRSGPAKEAEAAFAVLVARHGPMVMHVCRRILGDRHDAEDAAQATFLVLAQQARSIRRMDSVASWLYKVATQVAARARRDAARRRVRECRSAEVAMAIRRVSDGDPDASETSRELYEELGRLPDRFRLPILLCHLEGLTYEQAARQLGCPVRTVQSRLARARQRLRDRLIRRGMGPAVAPLAAVLNPDAASAVVSESWTHATVQAAVRYAASGTPAAIVSATAAALAEGATRAMTLHRLMKWAAVLSLLIGVAVGGAGMALLARAAPTAAQEGPAPAGPGAVTNEEPRDGVILSGTVVDEAQKPVPGATVVAYSSEKSEPVKTGPGGRFQVEVSASPFGDYSTTLQVSGNDGRLGLLQVYKFYQLKMKPELKPVTVVLKPAKAIEVRVVDREGKPVEGAEVGFTAARRLFDQGRTDAEGRWNLKVAADSTAWGCYALKSRAGFDYAVSTRAYNPAEPLSPLPLPEHLTLTLDGVRPPLRIKAVDATGKPLADVEIGVSGIAKPGHESSINLGSLSRQWPRTDETGVITLDWLPERVTKPITFSSHSSSSYTPDGTTAIPADKSVDELTITHLPYERLSGRVTTPDGQPAAGVKVLVRGRGRGAGVGMYGFQRETTTGADGRYSCNAYSEHLYMIIASGLGMVTPCRSDVIVRAGKPVADVDLGLVRGTRVRGRVTVGKDQEPAAAATVKAKLDQGSIPAEFKRAGDRKPRSLELSLIRQTDEQGRYEFVLGPGEYTLQGPARVEPVKLAIPLENPPAELVRDFAMPRPEAGPFKLIVVDAEHRPVAGAVVNGTYASGQARFDFYPTKTDANGVVRFKRSLDPLVIHVETPDKSLAGIARIDAEATETRIVVAPTATATGRLVDPAGKPQTRRELSYGIWIYMSPNRTGAFRPSFGGSVTTDDQGRFTCAGLVVGETYDISITIDVNRLTFRSASKKLAPKNPGTFALGDVAIDSSPRKPYVPPTPAERTHQSFAAQKEKSLKSQFEQLLVESKREYTRPLLLFGAPKDPACVELFRLFQERLQGDDAANGKPRVKSPAELRWEFELASLDTAKADVLSLAQELGVSFGDEKRPTLAVLSDEGKLVATYPLRLGADKTLDARELGTFLLEHKLATRDAEVMLADGLAKAKAEDKRVFLIMSASWCGPCRLLARFLAANKEELQRHYVFVKLDVSRDAHAETLRKRYKGAESGGVPWFVILDSSGAPLITSNAEELAEDESSSTNIGFPSSKEAIDHFAKMLKQTAPRLSGEALATLRERLSTKP